MNVCLVELWCAFAGYIKCGFLRCIAFTVWWKLGQLRCVREPQIWQWQIGPAHGGHSPWAGPSSSRGGRWDEKLLEAPPGLLQSAKVHLPPFAGKPSRAHVLCSVARAHRIAQRRRQRTSGQVSDSASSSSSRWRTLPPSPQCSGLPFSTSLSLLEFLFLLAFFCLIVQVLSSFNKRTNAHSLALRSRERTTEAACYHEARPWCRRVCRGLILGRQWNSAALAALLWWAAPVWARGRAYRLTQVTFLRLGCEVCCLLCITRNSECCHLHSSKFTYGSCHRQWNQIVLSWWVYLSLDFSNTTCDLILSTLLSLVFGTSWAVEKN
jgi:hypothetical protein